MPQAFPRYCPRCGTATRAKMRLCPICGLSVAAMLRRSRAANRADVTARPAPARSATTPTVDQERSAPPSAAIQRSSMPPASQHMPVPSARTRPVLPGSRSSAGRTAQPQGSLPPPQQKSGVPASRQGESREMGGGAIPPISQGVSPKQGVPLLTARARSQRRAAVVLVLLSLLLMLGAGGYLAFAAFGKQLSRLGMGQAPVITVNLRLPVTYAGMNVTLLDVQRARNFVDDPWSADNGMVRVRLREQNGTTVPLAWNCAEIVRLLVRGQRAALAPVFLRSPNTLAPGAMQTSLLDFAVPENDALASMHLRLGAANEAQIFIPLTNKANLSQYGAQTRPQHTSTGYFGLNWALLTSTTSLSMPGQQASSGMEYLTLALRVDNPLIQEVITGSPFDYARFKVGNRTFAPVDSTLPVSFASRAQGRTGAITFLIPQKSTAGALLLLSQDAGESGQATANVQIG